MTGSAVVGLTKRLVSSAARRCRRPGLLILALLLGACAGPGEEPAVDAGETSTPPAPVSSVAPPNAIDEPATQTPTIAPTATPSPVTAPGEVATEAPDLGPTPSPGATAAGEDDMPPAATKLQAQLGLPAGTVIALHQTGGFAGVDNLTIFYEDGRILLPSGEAVTVSAEDVANQVSALDAIGYFEMGRPDKKPICCDNFIYTVYARDGQREQVMTVNWGDPDLSEELKEIILALQNLVAEAEKS